MFTIRPADTMEVSIAGISEPMSIGVVRLGDKVFFKATKTNSQFEHIITKSTGQKRVHSKISHITVLESIKQLRDAKYKEHLLSFGTTRLRSRRYKAFVLQLPGSDVIKAPAVGDIPSIDMLVLMGSLVYGKCDF